MTGRKSTAAEVAANLRRASGPAPTPAIPAPQDLPVPVSPSSRKAKLRQITVANVDPDVYRALRTICLEWRTNMSEVVRALLNQLERDFQLRERVRREVEQ